MSDIATSERVAATPTARQRTSLRSTDAAPQPASATAPAVRAIDDRLATLLLRCVADRGATAELHPLTHRLLQRVDIAGKPIKNNAHNHTILRDALMAIIECQDGDIADPDSWIAWAAEINLELQTNGVSAKALAEIELFYQEAEELSFFSNPVLAEAWRRCMASTRKNSMYAAVGGKFNRKLPEVLAEIKRDFPKMADDNGIHLCDYVVVASINKEHQINKGKKFGGAQTHALNLQYAGIPTSGGSLSEFHKALHALKSGTGDVDYNAMDIAIRKIIEKSQKAYREDSLGALMY